MLKPLVTRYILLGAILIVMMDAARGPVRHRRVEIV